MVGKKKGREKKLPNGQVLVGDCNMVLDDFPSDSVDLVYLDPPFFTQRKLRQKTRSNDKEYAFEDTWESIDTYREYMKTRLEKCKAVLKKTGSIFLHCDRSASHHLRLALDQVFGSANFQAEIVWFYKRWSNAKKGLLNTHQVIYFYSKSKQFKFNKLYTDYSVTTNVDQIFQQRTRNEHGKSAYKTDGNGTYVLQERKKGVPLGDVWEIPYLNPKAKERVGYPTQKPILLLEQIIELVTDEGDLVVDPFCGSGTTLVAAQLMNRKFIGIDASQEAVDLTKSRLANPIKTESNLLKKGKSAYVNQDAEITALLESVGALPVQRNKGIDGFIKKGEAFAPIPIRVQRTNESFSDVTGALLKACQRNNYEKKIILKLKDVGNLTLFDEPCNIDPSVIVVEDRKQLMSVVGAL